MNDLIYPTKEEWMKETIDLLAEREKQIAEYRRDGADIPNSALEVAGEIRNTIQQRSTGQMPILMSGRTRQSKAKSDTRNI
jgi:hypothetical protein